MAKTISAEAIVEVPRVEFPVIKHKGRNLGFRLFGPATYNSNVAEMQKTKYRSAQTPVIALNPATTSQSISLAVDDPRKTKTEILDPRWLQLAPYIRASDGVFLNPPRENGEIVEDEQTLRSYLKGTKKVNGIYVVRNAAALRDFAFVPAETYSLGAQEHRAFLEGGLARGFEHTTGSAKRLPLIANSKLYSNGVYVYAGFKPTDKPGQTEKRVACLLSDRDVIGRLYVGGGFDDGDGGFAFGVFDAGEASAPEK